MLWRGSSYRENFQIVETIVRVISLWYFQNIVTQTTGWETLFEIKSDAQELMWFHDNDSPYAMDGTEKQINKRRLQNLTY